MTERDIVGAVVLSTGAVGLPAVDAVGVWSNWLHLTTSSAVLYTSLLVVQE